MFCTGHTDVFLQGLRVMYPINAAAVIIEERMHMTGEHYSVLCDSEEMIVAIFVGVAGTENNVVCLRKVPALLLMKKTKKCITSGAC